MRGARAQDEPHERERDGFVCGEGAEGADVPRIERSERDAFAGRDEREHTGITARWAVVHRGRESVSRSASRWRRGAW